MSRLLSKRSRYVVLAEVHSLTVKKIPDVELTFQAPLFHRIQGCGDLCNGLKSAVRFLGSTQFFGYSPDDNAEPNIPTTLEAASRFESRLG